MEQGVALVTTRIEQETEYVGRRIGEMLEGPMVVALQGELGSGKTVFVRGAAKGLAVEQAVTSPTFILLKVYQGRLPVYHFDFYRLEEPEELDYLGFEEYLPGDGVAFVEWAERFPDILPDQRLDVSIERFYDRSGEGRSLWFSPHGKAAAAVVERLMETITWRTDGSLYMPFHGPEQETRRFNGNC